MYTLWRVSNLGELCKTVFEDFGRLCARLHLLAVLRVRQ